MLKKEYQIVEGFIKQPWKKLTFNEIRKISGKKSKSYLYNSIRKFLKEKILIEEKVGNVNQYYLNNSLKTISYIGFVAENMGLGKSHIPYTDIEKITSKIPTNFFILLITGSYAKNTQKKNSDIDLVIICDKSTQPDKIYAELRYDAEMNIPKIHLYVFKDSEFLAMLTDKKANYGKEIIKNNIILSGGKEYYKIIGEAIKNGFNG